MSGMYWNWVRVRAAELESDGCTGVPDFYADCCLEHDLAYRTGLDPRASFVGRSIPISRAAADRRLRECIQARSKFGRFSPLSWTRWAGLRLLNFLRILNLC